MALVVANVGENLLLQYAFKTSSGAENFTLKLFTNNYTPVAGSIASNFTECAISGYSAKTLTRGSWNDASTNGSNKAEISYATQSWTFSGSGTVYGYYVVSASGGVLLWAELFPSARTIASTDVLNLTPKFTFNSES